MYCEPSAKPLPLTFTRVPPTDAPLLGLIEATLGCSWKTKSTEALPTNCCAFSDTRTLTAPRLLDGVKHASSESLMYEAGWNVALRLTWHTYSEPKLKAWPLTTIRV